MQKTLQEVMSDMPEAYVKKAEIVVTIKNNVSENRYAIEDSSMTAFLEFSPDSNKYRDRLELHGTYRFFSLERINANTLLFRKNSYLIKENNDKAISGTKDKDSYITTKDLIDRSENTVVKEPILLKVMRIYELRQTSNRIGYRKILLGDQYFQLHITLWRDDAKNVSKFFELDQVDCQSKFIIDSWPKNTENLRPKDIKYDRRNTNIERITTAPSIFDTVGLQNNSQVLIGKIRFLDDLYAYKSCPGKTQFCGKSVKPGQVYCSKIGCSLKVVTSQLVDDYRVKLMILDNEHDFHAVTAFAKSLKTFEEEGDSITEKLGKLIGPTVKIFFNPSKDGDDPILNKIEIVD